MDTRHSWQCALESLRWTATCSRSSYAWMYTRSRPGSVHWPRCGQYIHIIVVQVNRELQDVHLTLRHSKDGQGRDRLLPRSRIRTVHRRGSRMEHSPPMLRHARVRCCIAGSECQWRQVRHEPLYHTAWDAEDRPGQLVEHLAVVVRPGGRRCWRAHCVPAWPK